LKQSSAHFADGEGEPVDLELGTRRARAAAMLMLALPGCAYVYQGEELGLPQVDDLPDEILQDPVFKRTNGELRVVTDAGFRSPGAKLSPRSGSHRLGHVVAAAAEELSLVQRQVGSGRS
jgi:glycosidase